MYRLKLAFSVVFAIFLMSFAYLVEIRGVKDSWSEGCTEGTYYTLRQQGCEPIKDCNIDEDCNYLDIDKMPQRHARCESGQCAAYCGNIIKTRCSN